MASTITLTICQFVYLVSLPSYSTKIKHKYGLVVSEISTLTPEETICKSAQTKKNKGGNPRMKHLET